MIENILIRKQTPMEDNWLYRFDGTQYIISTCVYLGKEDTEWDECDEEQKSEFEAYNATVQAELEKQSHENVE